MIPQTVNLTAYKWSTVKFRLNAVKSDGSAWDLTGYTGVLQVRDDNDALLLERDNTNGIEVDASGFVDVTLLGTVTGPVTWDAGRYDLFLINSGTGRRYVLATGSLAINPSVADFS